jgi:hypothetical protein
MSATDSRGMALPCPNYVLFYQYTGQVWSLHTEEIAKGMGVNISQR